MSILNRLAFNTKSPIIYYCTRFRFAPGIWSANGQIHTKVFFGDHKTVFSSFFEIMHLDTDTHNICVVSTRFTYLAYDDKFSIM
ncbi:hypothetical protein CICLE_v10029707mg [Citrus x clementina]|uniref:Uncharacterized protein n=1 Tax=Citrus clementina TaxID=85681 RepID=V4UCB8_CITCL|nr:hypothetical protein CICLE_v10029707mg [Citrus x clementina]